MDTSQQSGQKRDRVTDKIEARTQLLKYETELPEDSHNAMIQVNLLLADTMEKVRKIVIAQEHDPGRLVHALDLLLQTAHTVKVSLELPHVTKPSEN